MHNANFDPSYLEDKEWTQSETFRGSISYILLSIYNYHQIQVGFQGLRKRRFLASLKYILLYEKYFIKIISSLKF